jgi:hypothetical protein
LARLLAITRNFHRSHGLTHEWVICRPGDKRNRSRQGAQVSAQQFGVGTAKQPFNLKVGLFLDREGGRQQRSSGTRQGKDAAAPVRPINCHLDETRRPSSLSAAVSVVTATPATRIHQCEQQGK